MHVTSRRRFLAAFGAGSVGTLAGCLGDDSYSGPDASGETVDELPPPTIGSTDASVTLTVYEDFACPHCATFNESVKPTVMSDYVDTGDIMYQHRDYPIPVHEEWSWRVASAARAVQDEADAEAFFAFADAIFQRQSAFSLDTIEAEADTAASVGEAARSAADQMTYRPVIESDKSHAEDLGVDSTPSLAIDGELVDLSNAATTDDVGDILFAELDDRL